MNKFLTHNWLVHEINKNCTLSVLKYVRGDLLDIGCGEKPYFNILKPRVNKYIGVEHPDTLHKNAKIDIYGDAGHLPFKDESFDTVVSFQVIEHVNEPNQMVAGIYRVISKGGYAILTAPFMWGLHEEPRDFWRYTKYGLKYLFEKNGFEIVELRANSGYWIMTGLRFNYLFDKIWKGVFEIPVITNIFYHPGSLKRARQNR